MMFKRWIAQVSCPEAQDQREIEEEDDRKQLLRIIAVRLQNEDADLDAVFQTETGDEQVDDRQYEFDPLVSTEGLGKKRYQQAGDLDQHVLLKRLEVPAVLEDDDPVVERDKRCPHRIVERLAHVVGTVSIDQIQDHHIRQTEVFEELPFDEWDLLDQVDDIHTYASFSA